MNFGTIFHEQVMERSKKLKTQCLEWSETNATGLLILTVSLLLYIILKDLVLFTISGLYRGFRFIMDSVGRISITFKDQTISRHKFGEVPKNENIDDIIDSIPLDNKIIPNEIDMKNTRRKENITIRPISTSFAGLACDKSTKFSTLSPETIKKVWEEYDFIKGLDLSRLQETERVILLGLLTARLDAYLKTVSVIVQMREHLQKLAPEYLQNPWKDDEHFVVNMINDPSATWTENEDLNNGRNGVRSENSGSMDGFSFRMLRKFESEDDVFEWVELFELIATSQRIPVTSWKTAAALYFGPDAKLWYSANKRKYLDWFSFKTALSDRFSHSEADIMQQLHKIYQFKGESLEHYIDRFEAKMAMAEQATKIIYERENISRTPELNELELCTIFVRGLSSAAKNYILDKHVYTYQQAKIQLKHFNSKFRESVTNTLHTQKEPLTATSPFRVVNKQTTDNRWNKPIFNPSYSNTDIKSEQENIGKEVVCYKCGTIGHYATECPVMSRITNNNIVKNKPTNQHVKSDSKKLYLINNQDAQDIDDPLSFLEDNIIFKTTDSASEKLAHVLCKINNNEIIAILDCGSTTNIISLEHMLEMNLELHTTNATFTFANNESGSALGKVFFELQLENKKISSCAYVFANIKYALLLGKPTLQKLQLSTNWETNQWYIQNGEKNEEVEIYGSVGDWKQKQNQNETTPHWKLKLNNNKAITEEMRGEILKLTDKINFIDDMKNLKPANVEPHVIQLSSNLPLSSRVRPLPKDKQEFVDNQIQSMLEADIIVPVTSSWSSAIVIVPKAENKLRLCVDYRPINKITELDKYPLPIIDEIFRQMQSATFFSKLDLFSGFYQIPMEQESIKYTTFCSKQGLFAYKCMPFGLVNAPATFQRTMDNVLRPFLNKNVAVYLDDIVVYSPNWEQHVSDLEAVLSILYDKRFSFNPDKCEFAVKNLNMLGHTIQNGEIISDKRKIAAIQELVPPQDVKMLRRFLGITGYYRKFIPHYSKSCTPLYNLLKKNQPFVWKRIHEKSFLYLKNKLAETPILKIPDDNKHYYLWTDASKDALGGVLTQKYGEQHHPNFYMGRSLNPAEKNYTIYEKEVLAVIYCLSKCRQFLIGRTFTLFTDNQALRFILNKQINNSRINRWIISLMEYRFNIEHISTYTNIIADTLSRNTFDEKHSTYQLQEVDEYEDDLVKVIQRLQTLAPSTNLTENENKKIANLSKQFIVIGSRLYRGFNNRFVEVLPKSKRVEMIHEFHANRGHFGRQITFRMLRKHYWWPNYYEQLSDILKGCIPCAIFSKSLPQLTPLEIRAENIFELWSLDFVGPLPTSVNNNRYILLAVENYSRWILSWPLEKQTAEDVIQILRLIIHTYGRPKFILTDNGSPFVNALMRMMTNEHKIIHCRTPAYTPHVNGLAERANQIIIRILEKLSFEQVGNWDIILPNAIWHYNVRPIRTKGNISPYEMLYKREPYPTNTIPYKEYLDPIPLPAPVPKDMPRQYNVGDLVWVFRRDLTNLQLMKFQPRWMGPFRVIKSLGTYLMEISDEMNPNKVIFAHSKHLKPYHGSVI